MTGENKNQSTTDLISFSKKRRKNSRIIETKPCRIEKKEEKYMYATVCVCRIVPIEKC